MSLVSLAAEGWGFGEMKIMLSTLVNQSLDWFLLGALRQIYPLDGVCPAIEAHQGAVAAPKMTAPGAGWPAYFRDCEGDMTGVMEDDSATA